MQPLIAMLVPAIAAEGTGAATGLSGQNTGGQTPASGFDALVAALTAAGSGVTLAADGTPVPTNPEKEEAKPLARPDQTAEGASLVAVMLQMAGLQPVTEMPPSVDGEALDSAAILPAAAPAAPTAAAEPETETAAATDPLRASLPDGADIAADLSAPTDDVSQTIATPPVPPPVEGGANPVEATLTVAAAGMAAPTSPSGLPSAVEMLRSMRGKTGDSPRSAISTEAGAVADAAQPSTATQLAAAATDADAAEGPLSDNAAGLPNDGLVLTPDPSTLAGAGESAADPASAITSPAGQTSVAAVREVAASQHLQSTRMAGGTHLSPAAQLTGRIEQAVSEGQTTLTVRLDPEELGRVEVKLELQDGRVTASIAAERPATLDLLQRDARLLERAVQQSGLQLSDAGMQFSLREGGGQWAEAQGGQRRGGNAYGAAATEPAADPLSPVAVYQSDSLVDIQI